MCREKDGNWKSFAAKVSASGCTLALNVQSKVPHVQSGNIEAEKVFSSPSTTQGCPAKIIIAVCWASQQLVIMAVNPKHNHKVSPETYKAYSECRELSEEEV